MRNTRYPLESSFIWWEVWRIWIPSWKSAKSNNLQLSNHHQDSHVTALLRFSHTNVLPSTVLLSTTPLKLKVRRDLRFFVIMQLLVTDSLWHSHIFYVTYCKVFLYIQPYKHIAHCYLGNLEYTLHCHRRWSYPLHRCSVRKTTKKNYK